ncbi:hypothetical protein DPMN_027686 [Dreissena polymorpha]|uniref:Uncharacterized protein n=1 Tax=Dreissena polymorpha TaxID=45954 RepID=A0A9D4LVT0_DREPO|nr:hypothetical protein DPMN_027686 [Dreissena polymorpha]
MDEFTPCVREALHGLNIKSLTLSSKEWGELHAESLNQSLSSLKRLEILGIGVTEDSPGLWKALHGLNIKSLRLDGLKGEGLRINHLEPLSHSLSSLEQMKKLTIHVQKDSPWEAIYGLNIEYLNLRIYDNRGELHEESLSQSLSSLMRLQKLEIHVDEDITGYWDSFYGLNIKKLRVFCKCKV